VNGSEILDKEYPTNCRSKRKKEKTRKFGIRKYKEKNTIYNNPVTRNQENKKRKENQHSYL